MYMGDEPKVEPKKVEEASAKEPKVRWWKKLANAIGRTDRIWKVGW